MGISKRIFFYSLGIVGVVSLLIIAYFTLMLSKLYANQVEVDRVTSLKNIQKTQLLHSEDKLIDALNEFDTPTSVIALALPKDSETISVTLVYNSFEIKLNDAELVSYYQEIIALIADFESLTESEIEKKGKSLIDKGKELLKRKRITQQWDERSLLQFIKGNKGVDFEKIYNQTGKKQVYQLNDEQYLIEQRTSDKTNAYSSYIGFSQTDTAFYLVFAGALTPKMTDLQRVIYQSLPTIIAVVLVFVLIATMIFSKILVTPLNRLSLKMAKMKTGDYQVLKNQVANKPDEYEQLAYDLNSLYQELVLQKKYLEEQNMKQKMFLAASSHQLKTPVTAALLLVEGMMAELGKYKDTKRYLPEVKGKMLMMEQIINDILLIDQQISRGPVMQTVNVTDLLVQIAKKNELLITSRQLILDWHKKHVLIVNADAYYLEKIIENLLSNALKYTPNGGVIAIRIEEEGFVIENSDSQVPKAYIAKIFEPFVRPSQGVPGHGLGLYLVAQYAELLGVKLTLENDKQQKSVVVTVKF